MEKRFRPALKPYAKLCLVPVAILAAIAAVSGFLYPEDSLPVFALAAIVSAFCIIKFLDYAYMHFFTEYVVDDSEITMIYGVWAKDENHVPIDKIEDYNVDRSILSKILGLANIGIQTARGERGFEVTLYSIPESEVKELDEFLDRMTRGAK